jgi:hypothetical protein
MSNYKDLRVFDEAHRLTLAVYKATQAFPKDERFGLTSQIRRASVSIAANLAEGAADGPTERWLDTFRSRWGPSYHLLLAKDLGFLKEEDFGDLSARTDRVMKMLSALVGKLKRLSAA